VLSVVSISVRNGDRVLVMPINFLCASASFCDVDVLPRRFDAAAGKVRFGRIRVGLLIQPLALRFRPVS
jgi:hypothetical protein